MSFFVNLVPIKSRDSRPELRLFPVPSWDPGKCIQAPGERNVRITEYNGAPWELRTLRIAGLQQLLHSQIQIMWSAEQRWLNKLHLGQSVRQ